ncbi:uncharacterized protein [Arachis hypogaea]|uniref:uncharacterized protein n=1 Tax=Arachis hypogaea TaxID=3818 RepID=UPI003B22123F
MVALLVTANPWDLSTVPGGSAAAVSARQCVVSLGSDTGESVKLSKFIDMYSFADAFGENGRPASGDESAVPPNASLQIDLELISWKAVSDITKDKKVLKKTLKEGEGYERPNDGAVVQALIRHILSIDIDPESLEIASLNAEELKVDIDFIQSNVMNLRWRGNFPFIPSHFMSSCIEQ